jgi:hypothetical protein
VSVGLDLGSTQFRSLRRQSDRLVGRMCRPVYALIPDGSGQRRLLDRDQVAYAECDGSLVLLGDAAEEWSQLLQLPLQPLLPDGQLPAHDPLARQILSLIIDAVLPTAAFPQERCCLTIPGELLPLETGPERGFFTRLVALRGYQPLVIGPGLAIVLSELTNAAFSGIGISLGATQCEFALVRSGIEHARCAIPWGTAEIVEELQRAESSLPTLRTTSTAADRILSDFLVELLLEAGSRIGQQDGFRVLTQPVSIACAGGLTSRAGFEHLLEQAWLRASWPIAVQRLRVAGESAYTVARGCLIRAKLEAQPQSLRAVA